MAEWTAVARPAGSWADPSRPVGSWAQEGSLVQEGDVWMVSTRPVSEGRFLREDDVVYVTAGSNAADPIGIRIRAGAVTLVDA